MRSAFAYQMQAHHWLQFETEPSDVYWVRVKPLQCPVSGISISPPISWLDIRENTHGNYSKHMCTLSGARKVSQDANDLFGLGPRGTQLRGWFVAVHLISKCRIDVCVCLSNAIVCEANAHFAFGSAFASQMHTTNVCSSNARSIWAKAKNQCKNACFWAAFDEQTLAFDKQTFAKQKFILYPWACLAW